MITNNSINYTNNIRNIYVSSSTGSDIHGNGTILYPWATINFALSQITTASSTNIFQINCIPGVYSETSLSLKPFVFIDGGKSQLILSGNITLTGFLSGGNISFGNFFGVTVSGGISLSPGSALSVINLYDIYAELNLNITITGASAGSNGTFALLDNIKSKFGSINALFIDLDGYVSNSSFNTLTYTATNASINHVFNFYSNYFSSNVLLQKTGSGIGVISDLAANRIIGTFTASGSGVNVRMDVDSCTSVPSAVSSASITFVNLSDNLSANYSPINYTPTNTSVKGNLEGIDNKLGIIGQYFSSSVLAGSAISLSSGTTANVTSLLLQPGDYDVRGNVTFVPGALTTSTLMKGAINTVSATLPTNAAENNTSSLNIAFAVGQFATLNVGSMRINIASPTTVYLLAQSTFILGTMNAYGFISARRFV